MITLGIETSCDETSVALFKNSATRTPADLRPGTILSNVVYSSLKEHRRFGGVVPEIASRAHVETILPCVRASLKKARITLKRIDLIAVTQGPGLMGSLLVGISAAKALSLALGKPLVGVDHVVAHVYSGCLSDPLLKFPFLGLVVSGGHTLMLRMDDPKNFLVLGQTADDAAGEAFDKVAKILGLGYPGGPEIDRLARGQNTARFFFSRPILSKDSLDFSFSGIKTAVYTTVLGLKKKHRLTPQVKKEVAAGFQEAVCDVLVKKAFAASQRHRLKAIVVGGGVSANSRLRAKMNATARRCGTQVVFPSAGLCQDNAAMVAALGWALYKEGKRDGLGLAGYPRFGQQSSGGG